MKVSFDFRAAEGLADRLDALAGRTVLRASAVEAVNEVTARFDKEARRAMNAGLNLSDDYIARRMSVTRASLAGQGVVRAEIVSVGDTTVLSNYPYGQLSRTAGPRAKGDPKRGIAPGRKQAGVAVEVRRGGAKAIEAWFTMTLRRGTAAGDKVGVFYRHSTGRVSQKYGPAPYSLFRHQVETRIDELNDDLQRTATARMSDAVQKALT